MRFTSNVKTIEGAAHRTVMLTVYVNNPYIFDNPPLSCLIAECPGGVNCDSTIPGHFRKFRHTLLANVRAGVTTETGEGPGEDKDVELSRCSTRDYSGNFKNKNIRW